MTETPSTDNVPETLDGGRYHVERVIGVGGSATVLLALDTRMQVRRAIKLLKPDVARVGHNRARFKAEAHAQAELQHPNVLMVHDALEDAQGVYLVMEFAENGSLGDRLDTVGPMAVGDVLNVGVLVGGALAVAHTAGIVHRDIKPANILVDRHGAFKLADFGIALDLGRAVELTRTAMVMGTWAYMPPEQRQNSHEVDHRSDIYAFGVTLYALLTGRTSASLHNQEGWATAYAGVPPALATILQRATRFDPEDRYTNVADMVMDLARLREDPAGWIAPTPADALPSRPVDVTPRPVDVTPPAASARAPTLTPVPAPRGAGWALPVLIAVGLLGVTVVMLTAVAVYIRVRAGVPTPAVTEQPVVAPVRPPVVVEPAAAEQVAAQQVAAQQAAAQQAAAQQAAPPSPVIPPPSAPEPPGAGATPPPVRPSPTPVGAAERPTSPRIIAVIPDATPAATAGATPPGTAPPAMEASGKVIVRTIPSGATVRERGRTLTAGVGDTYTLSMGNHTLELSSASGEATRIAVAVKAGETVQICYDFDTNSSCGGGR